ncbi:mannosyltransferase family protein [Dactylosporangium sucinum]|uniref:Membrane protein n=1 Tax=Dactylosporangium sucinum TaxID=1424081 RepID=A0A917TE58_9ACTN|nr:mannosyltransferase family protein [Dactylosporangium sucinum]GGM20106.1 membrane protein [Dactylosporangium sucinum]
MTPTTEVLERRRNASILLAYPLGLYALSRLVQLCLVWWMADDGKVRDRLLAWDGGHFVRVAEEGYPTGYTYNADGVLVGNGLAFFPGYPMLVRLTHFVTRLDYPTAAITVSWIAGGAAAVLLCALGTRLYDQRAGLALTALFCMQPMSMALSMAYSEALFTALVAGMLLFAHRGDWLLAGALGLGAALTRPTGAAAAIALAVAAGITVYRGRGTLGTAAWKPIAAALVALAGVPAYLLWVGMRVGDLHAWFDIQTAGWGTTFDYGTSSLKFVRDSLRAGDGWVQVSIAWMVIGVVILAAAAVAMRVWPPLTVYGLLVLVLVLGQGGYYHSKPRLLVPALLILVPPAVALARARPRTAALVLAGFGAFGLWYGSYLITAWHYAI